MCKKPEKLTPIPIKPRKNKKGRRSEVRAFELLYEPKIDGKKLMDFISAKKYGLLKGFSTNHIKQPKSHTHAGIILRQSDIKDFYTGQYQSYFAIPGYKLVQVGKLTNPSPNFDLKLMQYYAYTRSEMKHPGELIEDTHFHKWEPIKPKEDLYITILDKLQQGNRWDNIFIDYDIKTQRKALKIKDEVMLHHAELTRINGNINHIKTVELNTVQKDILEKLEKQDDRHILANIDGIGNCGKTYLAKHLHAKYGALVLTNAKTADIASAYNYQSMVVFNLTRTVEGRVNYGAIEALKDGSIFSGKYRSQAKLTWKPPKIMIMSNFDLDYKALSADRWDINIITQPQRANQAITSFF